MTAVGLEPNITAVKGQCHYPLDQAAILCGLITHTVADILIFDDSPAGRDQFVAYLVA